MDCKLISIVIPAFNCERFINQALESIISETHKSMEIVVVNDGSVNSTAEIVHGYPEVVCLYQKNLGNAAATNLGTEHAQGDLISFFKSR